MRIGDINLFSSEEEQYIEQRRDASPRETLQLVISATFVAEPVKEYIEWWGRQFHELVQVEFAPYNQVFQELLSPASLSAAHQGVNLLLVRFEDWIRDVQGTDAIKLQKLERTFQEFETVFRTHKGAKIYFVGIFPVSTHLGLSPDLLHKVAELNHRLREIVSGTNDCYLIDFNQLTEIYDVDGVFDPIKDKMGHLPFSDEFYAAMGAFIFRKLLSWQKQLFKVIVTDCDNTLWGGVCGEEGPTGVLVGGPYLELQKFLLEKYEEGMLLALCSKNNEADVWDVFAHNPCMLLKKEHFIAGRLNWKAKSDNLKDLAEELNLGLDSFIYLDDSITECSEVMTNCPGVLTLNLPEDPEQIPLFLRHVWAFDRTKVTGEDQKRNQMYLIDQQRRQAQREEISTIDFLRGLELKVAMNLLEKSQLARVSQLTQRTNQFNLSTLRRTEKEIEQLINTAAMECWVINVEDRFGDYGLVGVVITRKESQTLFLDTFLLSCRVLGREVETCILAGLKRYCRENNLEGLEATFYPTGKNKPFYEFIQRTHWEKVASGSEFEKMRLSLDAIPDTIDFIDFYYQSSLPVKNFPVIEDLKSQFMLDHIAVAVREAEPAKHFYQAIGFECGETVFDPLQKSHLAMCRKKEYDSIELVAPVESQSPAFETTKRYGNLPYHLCFQVGEFSKVLELLKDNALEYEVVSESKPAKLFGDRAVMFIFVKYVGLIELLQSSNTATSNPAEIRRNVIRMVLPQLEKPLQFYKLFGFIQEKIIRNHLKQIMVVTLRKAGSGRIELIVPMENRTPEGKFLNSNGPHLYQICYECDEIQGCKGNLIQNGYAVSDGLTEELNYGYLDNLAQGFQPAEFTYNLFFTRRSSSKVRKKADWKVIMTNEASLVHKNYLLPLHNYAAEMLVQLPVHEVMAANLFRTDYVAPQNELERKLAAIWEETFNLDQVGIHDNFFTLGGHSLKGVFLAARIYRDLNLELPLQELFKRPTIHETANFLAGKTKQNYPKIEAAGAKEEYRVTSAQKRLYILHQMEGTGISYNLPGALLVEGPLERERLEAVFQKLIERHEILRTTFEIVDGEPLQHIHPDMELQIQYIETTEAEASKIISGFIRPFELNRLPLLRVCLLKIGPERYIFVFDMHHIIADGVSINVMLDEFIELYQGQELPGAGIQYKDYAEWQQQFMKTELYRKQEQYWLEKFRGGIPILNLPTDNMRPAVMDLAGASCRFEMSLELTAQLKELAREKEATLFMILLAAWNVFFAKLTGQEDIVIGTPIAGRKQAEVIKTIGLFLNTLSLRNQPQPVKRFTEFLAEVKENTLQAYENQDYQYEDLLENLIFTRDISRNPLFDVLIDFQNIIDQDERRLTNLKLSPYPFETRFTKFDITIDLYEKKGGIQFNCMYRINLFKPATIQYLMAEYIQLLEEIVSHPERRLQDYRIFRRKNIPEIIQPEIPDVEYEIFNNVPEAAIGARFESQVRKYPDQIAIKMGRESYTYEELNRQANRIGRAILETETETVGLVFGHGPEMLAAMLGALKSGKIYIPLDPAYPESQLNYMLENAGVQTIITHQKYLQKAEELNPSSPMRIINIDEMDPRIPGKNIPGQVNPEQPAYIMYTSGSTGLPKGVIQSHWNILKLIGSYTNLLHLNQRDRIALFTSYSHAVGVIDILSAILNGATLYPYDLKSEGSMEGLSKWIGAEEITVYHSVPTVYRYWLDNIEEGTRFSKLRLIILGGEALHPKDVERYRRHFEDQCLLVNLFGSSEVLIATAYIMDKQVELKRVTVPVGYFIDGVTAVILDSDGEEAGVYGTGEIFYQSKYLALGYWKMPEQTKEVFGETGDGKRLYRSGDLGRFLPDGSLEFIGRRDSQVKVRGYRIELAGIEQILDTCIGIQKSVVTVWHGDQDEQIVAYYQTTGGIQIDAEEIRAELTQKLPDYMIPDYYIYLNQLPMTANGKIDRKALPKPDQSNRHQKEYEAPRDETEGQLAEIWQELLGVQRIGINDHFFELGGHSLKATSLVSRIHKKFNVEVPLQEIFKTPTIKGLSAYLVSAEQSKYRAIRPVAPQEYYPVSSAQKRMYILNQIEGSGTSYNTPGATLVEGKLEKETLAEIFQKLIQRHETLRTSFEMIGGEPVQKIHPRVEFRVEDADSNGGADSNPRLQKDGYGTVMPVPHIPDIIRNFIRPFDLSQAPLLRVGLIRINEAKHILLYDLHHIISDGTSMGILVREFISLYNEEELPPLRIQYKDFSGWQNQLFQTGILRKQEEYWLNQFQGVIPVLNLPTDEPRPIIQSFEGDRHEFRVDEERARQINQLALDTGTTLFMIILAAYNILLSKYSGQEDIIIGSPIAGRVHTDLDNIIGMFVNTLAFRNYPAGQKTFRQFLTEVKENSLKAYANQDYQFEELVEKLDLKRDLSRNPLFDVMFVLQNIDSRFREIRDLKFQPYPVKNTTAKFDLTLQAMEGNDGIYFSLEYCSKIFKAETIARMAGHLQNILRAIVNNPEIRISAIEMITGAEKWRILYEFNDTAAEYPREKTIHRLFEEQAEQTPENIAVVFGDKHLTYRELNQKANQLARVLQKKGTRPESIIGIMAERSLEMIVGILGVLKAGGAYLPIDPDYPPERIGYLLEDSRVPILLHHQTEIGNEYFSGLKIDLADDSWIQGNDTNLETSGSPGNLAYIIYTSGSTGRPKGVMIEHINVVRLLFNDQMRFDFSADDVWTMFHSYSFDFSVWEMYGALLYSGKLVMVPRRVAQDPHVFLDLLVSERVTILNQTPTAFYNLADQALQAGAPILQLRYVIFGGEALQPLVLKKWWKAYPATKLINMYGITETTVHVTYKEITSWEIEHNISNIGRPIPTSTVYILDQEGQILPAGIPGELCVGGAGVGRGYLGNPELTAEKFVPNPFYSDQCTVNSEQSILGINSESEQFQTSPFELHTSIIYRSGDYGRWLPEGELEYLGRIDHQVKIRGHRIELGEIESVLLSHESIKEAVVIARNERTGQQDLYAYLVLNEEISLSELRVFLQQRIPEYMVPAYFIPLEKIPLTTNGKVDRKALPLSEGGMETGVIYESPHTQSEAMLVDVWQEVLGSGRVGIHDNFFDLGGDSIKAIRLVGAINKAFDINIQIKSIYQYPQLVELAAYLKDRPVEITVQEIAHARKELEELKRSILADEKQRAILPADLEDFYPMSDIELGMIYYNLKNPRKAVYHEQFLYSIEIADFDLQTLVKAIQLLIEKHPILRTSFHLEDYIVPLQLVHNTVVPDLELIDLAGFNKQSQEKFIKEYLLEDRLNNPFQIDKSLWRIRVFNLGHGVVCVGLIFHHAILDGWSVASLITELSNLYFGIKEGQVVYEKLKSSYLDFIIEQKIIRNKAKVIAYWDNELADYKRLNLNHGQRESAQENTEIISVYHDLTNELYRKLREVASKCRTNIKTLCFTAYVCMLNMISYENDIIVGLVEHNRPNCEDGDKVLGCCLNTIPVRIHIAEGMSWENLIQTINQKIVDLKIYGRLSLFEILRTINEDTTDENPIFDTLFNYVDFHIYDQIDERAVADLDGDLKPTGYEMTNTLFNFVVLNTSGKFGLKLDYSPKVFSKSEISNFIGYYKTILNEFINDPNNVIDKDKILSNEEKQKILSALNAAPAGYPSAKTIHGLFGEQVERTQENIAVLFEGKQLTYRELNQKANQLARVLRNRGIKPDCIVGIMTKPSLEMIIGIFGVLKAGGAYLPIDPEYPPERIQYMIEDSQTEILLTQKEFAANEWTKEQIYLDEDGLFQGNASDLGVVNQSNDVMYIIYTSGTTGNPKGAMIEHRNVVSLLFNDRNPYDFTEDDIWTLFHSFCFDFSTWEIYGALLYGGKLIIIPRLTAQNPVEYLQLLKNEQVTILNQTPTVFYNLADEEMKASGCTLKIRYVIFGGEALQPIKLQGWHEKYPNTKLINMYGITETTVHVTYKEISDDEIQSNVSNIGNAIPTLTTCIMDQNLKLLPFEAAGELCVGGAGVGRGYLNRPDLTADKFVPNPFSTLHPSNFDAHARLHTSTMYRSGDLVRRLANGEMEYLGRIDHQVKIRGFRIELGEIERRLLEHEAVKEGIVVVKEDSSGGATTGSGATTGGDKYICAYIVAERELEIQEIRQFLGGKLPGYMIPSYFIRLEKLPLTLNGKVNRKALPEPGRNIDTGVSYEAPVNEIEIKLAGLWQEVLEVEKIGVHDNFFELGGHSLKATILSSRIHKVLHQELPLKEIFQRMTIREQAEYLQKTTKNIFAPILPVQDGEYPGGCFPMSSAQKRLFITNQMEQDGTHYNISGFVLMKGQLDMWKLESALQALVKRHESLRTSFLSMDDEPMQQAHPEVEFAITVYQGTANQIDEIIGTFIRPFDLSKAPLFRVGLLKLTEDLNLMMFDMHHIISDGVSINIMIREFSSLYQGNNLPDLRLQYKDFSVWQNKMLTTGKFTPQEEFWLTKLAGELPSVDIPADYPRSCMQNYQGDLITLELDNRIKQDIKHITLKTGTTSFMFILSTFTLLLSKYTSQEDIVVVSPTSGRSHSDLEKMVGMFVNLVVLRNFPKGSLSFEAYLESIRLNMLEVYVNQDYQFEQLVSKLSLNRNTNRIPLMTIAITMRNQDETIHNIKGLEMVPYEYHSGNSQFELHLIITETTNDLVLQLEYSTQLFKKPRIEKLGKHLIEIMNQVIENKLILLRDIVLSHDFVQAKDDLLLAENEVFEF